MSTSRILSAHSARVPIYFAVLHPRVHGARFNSNQANVAQKIRASPISVSHIISGLVGGGAVILGGYLFYHFSGIKPAVDTAVNISNGLKNASIQAKNSLSPPNEALAYLRSLAKSQVVFIPGGSWAVDSVFNSMDELHKTHRKEIDSIVSDAYNDIKRITDERGSLDRSAIMAILGVLRRRVGELGNVAGKASSDAVSPILSKYPGLRDALGGKWEEFRDFTKGHGPKTKKIYDEAENQIIETVNSKGVNTTSVATILQILREKSGEAKRVAGDTSWDAWERARRHAGSALEKLLDAKKVLDENTSALIKLGGGVATTSGIHARTVWDRVKQTAESTGRFSGAKLNEFKGLVSERVENARKGLKSETGDEAKLPTGGKIGSVLEVIPGSQRPLDAITGLQEAPKTTQSTSEDIQGPTHEGQEKFQNKAPENFKNFGWTIGLECIAGRIELVGDAKSDRGSVDT